MTETDNTIQENFEKLLDEAGVKHYRASWKKGLVIVKHHIAVQFIGGTAYIQVADMNRDKIKRIYAQNLNDDAKAQHVLRTLVLELTLGTEDLMTRINFQLLV